MIAADATSELAHPRFEHVERAGTGGSAEVMVAIDRRDGAKIALKMARDVSSREALAREATYAALAISPGLPELVDAGWLRLVNGKATPVGSDSDGRAYIALRWAEGRTLDASRPRSERARIESGARRGARRGRGARGSARARDRARRREA